VEAELAAPLAAHTSKVYFTPGLFARLDLLHSKLHDDKAAPHGLDDASLMLVDRLHLDFVRAGAKFDTEAQQRYGLLVERLAVLQTTFTQSVTLDETNVFVELSGGLSDLEGCPEDLVAAAKAAYEEQQKQLGELQQQQQQEGQGKGKKRAAPGDDNGDSGGAAEGSSEVAASLARSFVEPFLTYASKREVREKVFKAWSMRGELEVPARDNKPVALETLRLRAEQAAMHGFPSFAAFNVADTMAQKPENVEALLARVWGPAKARADTERQELEKCAAAKAAEAGGGDEPISRIEPWDWRYYSEAVRKQQFDLDEEELKPYLPLEGVLAAVFDVANKLFGVTFVEVSNTAPSYHQDVRTLKFGKEKGKGKSWSLSSSLTRSRALTSKAARG
jgi:peptidyl-dipeptidase Dcp